MNCKSCQGKNYVSGICRVHELLDNDTTTMQVKYCQACKACARSLVRRAKAFAKNLRGKK